MAYHPITRVYELNGDSSYKIQRRPIIAFPERNPKINVNTAIEEFKRKEINNKTITSRKHLTKEVQGIQALLLSAYWYSGINHLKGIHV